MDRPLPCGASPCSLDPADMEVPAGLDRRTFLGCTARAAALLALAACGDITGAEAPVTVDGTIDVSTVSALANVGGVALVRLGGASLAIVRTGSDTFLALSRVCPHQGGTINTSSTGFQCTRHGARFDSSGNWIGGERTRSMRSYPTTFDAATDILTVG